MAIKKIPVRRCIGCNEGKPKKELVRVVKTAEGEISVDATGKKSGRGAYICPNRTCLAKARKAKKLERAFSCAISDEIYDRLAEEVEERLDDTK
ncbi:MAG: YlxR family protein [Pygmaiobacter sp.]